MLILLGSILGVLVLLWISVLGLGRCLGRIERRLSEAAARDDPSAQAPGRAETSPGGAFEAFLGEDPERRKLPKGEQFAAYRKWRQEKGLNWGNS